MDYFPTGIGNRNVFETEENKAKPLKVYSLSVYWIDEMILDKSHDPSTYTKRAIERNNTIAVRRNPNNSRYHSPFWTCYWNQALTFQWYFSRSLDIKTKSTFIFLCEICSFKACMNKCKTKQACHLIFFYQTYLYNRVSARRMSMLISFAILAVRNAK